VIEKYRAVMASRDTVEVERRLKALAEAAAGDTENLMPHLVSCCLAYATVGEIVATLKQQWGEFQEPVSF
jgi:methylmalonyl-CoA mutase N-terminal domain/subunit